MARLRRGFATSPWVWLTRAEMLQPEQAQAIAEKIFRFSEADVTEVFLEATRSALTRFANNIIHQNVSEEGMLVSVRTVVDGRTARATTNKTDDESLRRVVASASSLARLQPRNPDLAPMLGPQCYQAVQRYSEATARITPEERARRVEQVVDRAKKHGFTAAGILADHAHAQALLNSKGLSAFYQETKAEFSVTFLGASSTGWAKANETDIARIDVDALAARASEKALRGAEPREIAPGRYTVILEPAAVLDLVGFVFYDFAATAVQDQRSFLTERLGKKIFGDNITLWDDVYHPLQSGSTFDGEGVPKQKVLLVERGVPRNLVYARATAAKTGAQPTGHGMLLPNEWGEAPLNLVFEGGTATLEEMLSSTERGILVTRLWYIREVDPYEKILTGMTRDGTFLVEGGRIVAGIKNFRFNESLIEMLSKVEMLGPAVRAAGEESFEMVVPAMKVRDFNFTEVTKF